MKDKWFDHVVLDKWFDMRTQATYFTLKDKNGQFMIGDAGVIARVDGGDPGDEDDSRAS